jgi:vancomycin permeability regulator SanA
MKKRDAILVLSGGIDGDGSLNPWTKARLDAALGVWSGEYFLLLSGTSAHKKPLVRQGNVVHECAVMARYLQSKGIGANVVLQEPVSGDTIGNAYFARTIHTDPGGLKRLLVVTSQFHMPRTRAIFEWVFGLDGRSYDLEFLAVPDEAAATKDRLERERGQIRKVMNYRKRVRTLAQFHRWLFSAHAGHDLYATGYKKEKITNVVRKLY